MGVVETNPGRIQLSCGSPNRTIPAEQLNGAGGIVSLDRGGLVAGTGNSVATSGMGMTEEPAHEQMERHAALTDELTALGEERDAVAAAVQDRLADAVSEAVAEVGTNVGGLEQSKDGKRFRFEARLDRAALVAAVTETLPDGFVVSHVNEDGTLSVDWTGDSATPSKREHGAILKAIIAEETKTDGDGFIESVPSRGRVLARAAELGVDEGDAADRLSRLATLDVVDITDEGVYPNENFARY
jgi:hypothetical protein